MTHPFQFQVTLPREIEERLAADLEKKSVTIVPDVLALKVDAARRSVTVTCASGADQSEVQGKVARYLDAMVAKRRPIETRTLFSRTPTRTTTPRSDVYQELLEREWMSEHGAGRVGLSGPALDILLGLDAYLRHLYQTEFEAVDQRFPTMIDADVLARCGYFESHPDTASFVSHLTEDFDLLESFSRSSADEGMATPPSSALAPASQCLCPSACFPCYHAFQNRNLTDGGRAVTMLGRIFRYESRNMNGLERLWEFNVREGVFLGTPNFVEEGRRRLVDLFKETAEAWDLDCRIETASDAFFPTVDAARSFWQEVTEVKYEIRLAIRPDLSGQPRDIAAGSINIHGSYFGERFGITLPDGGYASTGCCGWGLERWVLALFTQHGFDLRLWPSALRQVVGG